MRITITIAVVLISLQSFAQSGYKLNFKIKGLKDTTAYLGHYFAESTYLDDTARVDKQGAFVFDGKKALPQGVYMLVIGPKGKISKIFDLVVGHDQEFLLETDTSDFISHMKVTGDVDNKLFFENILFNKSRHEEASPYIKVLEDSTLAEDKKIKARAEFQKINQKVLVYQDGIIEKNGSTVTARLLKATKQIIVPDPPKKANGNIDSTFQLRYYRTHFFDYFDLADEAMLRMPKPFYQEKVKEYLEKLFLPQPDTIMNAIDALVAKAKKTQETYKYMVFTCLVTYQNPEIMGLDEVYVRIYDKYFATGEMDFWANAPFKKSIKEYADKVRRAMIGRAAPNLIMQDQNLQPKSIYEIKKKYTVVFFFDPECGHCRKESPKLVEFYNKNKLKYDLEVFAVASDSSMKKMRDYIKEMKMPWITVNGPRSYTKEHFSLLYFTESFPTIYILDDKKKILARKIPVDKIDDFLTNHEKFQKRKAIQKRS